MTLEPTKQIHIPDNANKRDSSKNITEKNTKTAWEKFNARNVDATKSVSSSKMREIIIITR